MSGSSSYKPVNQGKITNNVIPDASAQLPPFDHGSGSVGNDPPTGSKRRSPSSPARLAESPERQLLQAQAPAGSPENLTVSISSPDAKTDRKDGNGKSRKVIIGPEPKAAAFDPAHRAPIDPNLGVMGTGELRAACDIAFKGVTQGFGLHNARMDAIEGEIRKLIEHAVTTRTAVGVIDGNAAAQRDIVANLEDDKHRHAESIVTMG